MCLSRLPFFGLILQRLHSFSTDVIDRTSCANAVVRLAADLRETKFEELGHSAVYQVTVLLCAVAPCVSIVNNKLCAFCHGSRGGFHFAFGGYFGGPIFPLELWVIGGLFVRQTITMGLVELYMAILQ